MAMVETSVKSGEAQEYDRVETQRGQAHELCSSVVYGLEKGKVCDESCCHFWLKAWKGGCQTYWVETENGRNNPEEL